MNGEILKKQVTPIALYVWQESDSVSEITSKQCIKPNGIVLK